MLTSGLSLSSCKPLVSLSPHVNLWSLPPQACTGCRSPPPAPYDGELQQEGPAPEEEEEDEERQTQKRCRGGDQEMTTETQEVTSGHGGEGSPGAATAEADMTH